MLLLVPLVVLAQAGSPAPGDAGTPSDPAVRKDLEEGLALLGRNRPAEARDAFLRADRRAAGKCFGCLESLAAAESRLQNHAAAIEAARRALTAGATDAERARAHNQLGLAHAARGNAGDLDAAQVAYRKALALTGGELSAVRYNLAVTELRAGRRAQGLATLAEFLRREPRGPRSDQARALARHPGRAGEMFAPEFAFTTLSGATIRRDDLAGKVVLLDFWATWCIPCRDALPHLKDLRRRSKSARMEIISISVDRDRKALEGANGMDWTQCWDADGRNSIPLFRIGSFPTYVVMDRDGVVVHAQQGWSDAAGAEISARIERALKDSPESR